MRRLWQRLVDIGVDGNTDPDLVRYVRVTNGLAILISLWLLTTVPSAAPYLPASRVLVINGLLFPVLWMAVLWLNHRKHHLAARLYLGLTSFTVVTINASQLGRESENHLFLLAGMLGTFYTYGRREVRWIVLLNLLGAGLFVGLEVWFREHRSVLGGTRMSGGLDSPSCRSGCRPRTWWAMLNEIFSDFDALARRHGLEKIKTIGDAYMVAGGIPTARGDSCEAALDMALDLERVMSDKYRTRYPDLQLRVGIHCGSVVAGVIGATKFIYDLWGDSVNTASRMESHGVPGRIQVSEAVYERARARYRFEARGEVEVKGKGPMQVFLLAGRAAPAAAAVG